MFLVTKCTYLLTSPHINTESINPVSGCISQYRKCKRNNKSNSFLALIRIIKRTAKSIILQTSHPSCDSFLPSKGISSAVNTGTTWRTRWNKVLKMLFYKKYVFRIFTFWGGVLHSSMSSQMKEKCTGKIVGESIPQNSGRFSVQYTGSSAWGQSSARRMSTWLAMADSDEAKAPRAAPPSAHSSQVQSWPETRVDRRRTAKYWVMIRIRYRKI